MAAASFSAGQKMFLRCCRCFYLLRQKKTPPDFRNGKSGGVDALFVLFQALTQNLAKIFMQQPLRLTSWGQRIFGAALQKRCH